MLFNYNSEKRDAIEQMIEQDQMVLSGYDSKGKRLYKPISEVREIFKDYISKRRPYSDYKISQAVATSIYK